LITVNASADACTAAATPSAAAIVQAAMPRLMPNAVASA
jgi:hypothetical protein